jgi:hypothetical protein
VRHGHGRLDKDGESPINDEKIVVTFNFVYRASEKSLHLRSYLANSRAKYLLIGGIK